MTTIGTVWICESCEVGGIDPELSPACWNCGGPTVMTARTAVAELRTRTEPSWTERVAS